MNDLSKVSDMLRATREALEELNGNLSNPERFIASTSITHDLADRKNRAKRIIRAAIDASGVSYQELCEDSMRGMDANLLWQTMYHKWEPIEELRFDDIAGFQADVSMAMQAHGNKMFDRCCEAVGRKLVVAAIDYILHVHESEGLEAEDELRAEARRNSDE